MRNEKAHHRRCLQMLLAGAFLFAAPLSHAASVATFTLEPVTVSAGTTDTFDVILNNATGSALDVGGFAFGLSSASGNLTFTAVSFSPATEPYIFAGNSLFGPDISVQPPNLPGQTLEASDAYATPSSGQTVAAGGSEGLGLVTFTIAPGTPVGPIALSFISADDSLTDASGRGIGFVAINGSVTISGATVPEPATDVLAGLALAAIAAIRRMKSGV